MLSFRMSGWGIYFIDMFRREIALKVNRLDTDTGRKVYHGHVIFCSGLNSCRLHSLSEISPAASGKKIPFP